MDGKRALEDGKLVLFKRAGIWQARIAVTDRRYIYRSLKTSDEAKAVTAGRRLFYRTEIKLEQGLPVHLRNPPVAAALCRPSSSPIVSR